MLRTQIPNSLQFSLFVRSMSKTSTNAAKRFMQTAPLATNEVTYVPYKLSSQQQSQQHPQEEQSTSSPSANAAWSRHAMPSTRSFKDLLNKKSNTKPSESETKSTAKAIKEEPTIAEPQSQAQTETQTQAQTQTQTQTPAPQPKKRVRRTLRPRKALITLSPTAISHLRALLDQPTPQLIRIGVRNRGCSGLTYSLEYIEQPNKFDEVVEQDGVRVVIDSKALFSIVGSEMDWLDDKLSSRFVFKNPNSKGTCGCGESFMV